MRIFLYIVAALGAYLLGNVSTGQIVAGRLRGLDIRQHGSGNAGTTNVLRVLGRRPALVTFIGDFAKGLLAAGIGRMLLGPGGAMVCGLCVMVGHIWPALLDFRGGKGVATAIGVALVVSPLPLLLALLLGLTCVSLTRYVSLGSMVGITLYFLFVGPAALARGTPGLFWFALASAALVVFAHRGNIQRLQRGAENKLDFRALYKD